LWNISGTEHQAVHMNMDSTPQTHERVVCSIAAAAKYRIAATIVLAVAEKENGKVGQWVRNDNGTHDVGPLQFNTSYLRQLARYGISPADVAGSGCYPYDLAAWRLRQHIVNDTGDVWTRASNYHSRTPRFNRIYRVDLMRRAGRWRILLSTPEWGNGIPLPSAALSGAMGATNVVRKSAKSPSDFPLVQPAGYVPRRLLVGRHP
jgi:hypothetical protein